MLAVLVAMNIIQAKIIDDTHASPRALVSCVGWCAPDDGALQAISKSTPSTAHAKPCREFTRLRFAELYGASFGWWGGRGPVFTMAE